MREGSRKKPRIWQIESDSMFFLYLPATGWEAGLRSLTTAAPIASALDLPIKAQSPGLKLPFDGIPPSNFADRTPRR